MEKKPTYEELEEKIRELETEVIKYKRAEEALRESEEKYRSLFEGSENPITIMDRNGIVLMVNPIGRKNLNLPLQACVGKSIFEILPSLDRSYHKLYQQVVDEGTEVSREDLVELPSGPRWFWSMHQPFSDLSGRRYGVQVISYDITDRKKVEEALKESEEKFHVLFDSVLTGTYVTELGGDILDVNDAGARLLGFDSPEDLIGRKVVDSYKNPEDRARIIEGAKAGGIVGFEIEMVKENGSSVSVLISTSLVELHGRKVFLTSAMDITDRKKAEEALRESEEKFRSLADNAPDIIYTTDRAGVWTYANPAVEKILGYKRDDVIGRNLLDFTQEEVAREYINLFKRVRDGKETIRDVIGILTHKNRSSRFFNISGSPNLDSHGTVRGYVGLMKDITEQKKAEEALKDSEERYRAVLEYNPDPMVVYDIDGKVAYFNPAFTRVFGWTLEECLGHRLDFFVPEETWPETQKMLERGLTHGYFSGIESRRYTKEGNILDVSVSGAVHRDSQRKPERAIVNIRDITEQKRLEAQFQQAQKMEAIGTLAGGIAHNFNNLLTGILGNASIMILSIDSSNPHYKNLKNIEKMVQNGSKLTNQLLGYARGGRYEVKPISLNQLVKDTSDTFGETRKEITIHRELAKELYGIKADQGQIEQVLLNLYVNAAEAMPEGGDLFLKTMDVTVKDGRGKPYTLKPGNYVLLTVRDTGAGVDKENIDRIFDPFFTTKDFAKGAGLGLASAYGIVKGHGGHLDVDSEKGQGTTFSIYLPATEERIEEKKEFLSDELLKGDGTVLLVDDEDEVLGACEEMLRELGYEVLVAGSGKEALELYKENQDRIDLVLLDMVMPGTGGGQTYDEMKEINPDVRVLLSSGYSVDGEASEILKRGCDGFIQKPFNFKKLSQSIRDILEEGQVFFSS